MTTGWEKQWHDPKLVQLWASFPPVPEVVEMADDLQAEGRRHILDIGCGVGRHTLYLAARGFKVTAVDNAPTALKECRQRLDAAGFHAEIAEADMECLPYQAASFDGILSTNVIHHVRVTTLAKIIDDIYQMLKPGGFFVWVTPNPRHCDWGRGEEIEPGTWVDPTHEYGNPHHYCTETEVRGLLKAYEVLSLCESEREVEGRSYCHWRILARKYNR
jgi:tellurite methyltransferase